MFQKKMKPTKEPTEVATRLVAKLKNWLRSRQFLHPVSPQLWWRPSIWHQLATSRTDKKCLSFGAQWRISRSAMTLMNKHAVNSKLYVKTNIVFPIQYFGMNNMSTENLWTILSKSWNKYNQVLVTDNVKIIWVDKPAQLNYMNYFYNVNECYIRPPPILNKNDLANSKLFLVVLNDCLPHLSSVMI